MDSLITIIARQQELSFLNLRGKYQDYELTEVQESRIRSAVTNPDCRLIITLEEFRAYEAEQEQVKPAASVP